MSVTSTCEFIDGVSVSRAGFYEWRTRLDSVHTVRRRALRDMVTAVFEANHRVYVTAASTRS